MALNHYETMKVPFRTIELRAKLSKADLVNLNVPFDEEGVKLMDLLRALGAEYKTIRKSKALMQDSPEAVDTTLQKEREHLLSLQIKNQKSLGDLIPKAQAKHRMLSLLRTYRGMVLRYIRTVSVALPGDKRTIEILLTENFNKLLGRVVEDEAAILSWEEDGATKLLRTRLVNANATAAHEEMQARLDALVQGDEEDAFEEYGGLVPDYPEEDDGFFRRT